MIVDNPKGTLCRINGQCYKVGLHGKPFVHRDGDWVSTINYTAGEIVMRYEDEQAKLRKKGLI